MLALLALLFIGFGFAAWEIVVRIAGSAGKSKGTLVGAAPANSNKQNKRYLTGGKIMGNNGWLKLAIFSFVGILVSAAALGMISSGNPQQAMYQNGMQGMNNMPAMYGNANMQNGMNMGTQGMQNGMNMGMQGMQSGMNMGMQGMQGGMDSNHMMLAQQMQMIQQQVFQLQQQMQMMQGGSGSMSSMPQSSSSGMGMGMMGGMSNMPMGMGGMSSMPAGGSMSNMPSGGAAPAAAPAAAPMAPMPMM